MGGFLAGLFRRGSGTAPPGSIIFPTNAPHKITHIEPAAGWPLGVQPSREGNMVSVAESARITLARKAYKPDTSDAADPNLERAWLLHTAAVEEAKRTGATPNEQGQYEWVGALKRIARLLFPEVEWEDEDKATEFLSPVYGLLRAKGVARVIERNVGGPANNRWLLAGDFDNGNIVTTPKRKVEPTRTEKKLTKAEAGEDRTPEPVTVTKKPKDGFPCDECGVVFASAASRNGHVGAAHRRGKHRCTICGKCFQTGNALGGHRSTHVKGAEPYACGVCGKRFQTIGGLGGHGKAHTPAERAAAVNVNPTTTAKPKEQTVFPAIAAAVKHKAEKQAEATAPVVEVKPSNGAVADPVQAALEALRAALVPQADTSALEAENAALKARLAAIEKAFASA